MNWNTYNDTPKLRAKLNELRGYVQGCTFAQASEAFKDIEGCKARIAWLTTHNKG
jgi:hypothetical protein